MAEKAGYGGKFEYHASSSGSPATVVKGIGNWTVNYQADAHETTDYANAGVRVFVAGGTSWTGTISGYYDSSSAAVYNATINPGTAIACRFETSTASKDMTGVGIVTGMSFTTGIDGAITANLSIQGTGTLTIR